MSSQPFHRPINRNARPGHLQVVQAKSPEERKKELTWECVKGAPGLYKPMRTGGEDGPDNSEGLPFVYQGCGVMEPREILGRLHRRSCPCESKAREQYEKDKEARQWRESQIRACYGWLGERWSDIPLKEKTFANFDASRQPFAFEAVKEFAGILSGTLVLHGTFGTGKTHLLAALCNELRQRRMPSLFVTSPKLFNAIQGRIGYNESYAPLIAQAIRADLLVIDDIDKAKYTPFREEIYFEIIDERTKQGKPIAISTNRLSELENFVGGACASRLSMGQIEIEMTGEDYRKEL